LLFIDAIHIDDDKRLLISSHMFALCFTDSVSWHSYSGLLYACVAYKPRPLAATMLLATTAAGRSINISLLRWCWE